MDELTNEEKERYEKITKYLRNKLIQIRKNPFLSNDEKEKQIADINKKYNDIKKNFVKRLSAKNKYNRTEKKRSDKEEIERYI